MKNVLGDLIMYFFDPTEPNEVSMLLRNSPIRIFQPREIVTGHIVTVKHGFQKKVGESTQRLQWQLKGVLGMQKVEYAGNVYELIKFRATFRRNNLPAIPHKVYDYFIMVPFRDVYELHTETGILPWGFAREHEIKGVLELLDEVSNNTQCVS